MVTIPSDNVPLAVIRFARANAITEIVVGKSGLIGRARPFRRRTIAEQIMKMSGDIDVAVVQEKGATLSRPRVALSSYLRPERASLAKMMLAIAVVTGISLLALPVIGYRSVSILYLLAVIALAFFTNQSRGAHRRRAERPAVGLLLPSSSLHVLHHASSKTC